MIEYVDNNQYDRKIADMSLAAEGRKSIDAAKQNLPQLNDLLKKYEGQSPLSNVKVVGSLGVDASSAVLVEVLDALGAKVRWCSSAVDSTDNAVAAALAAAKISVFAWKGQSVGELWWAMLQALTFGENDLPDVVIDGNGKARMAINQGAESEVNSDVLNEDNGDDEIFELNEMLFMTRNKSGFWTAVRNETTIIEMSSQSENALVACVSQILALAESKGH